MRHADTRSLVDRATRAQAPSATTITAVNRGAIRPEAAPAWAADSMVAAVDSMAEAAHRMAVVAARTTNGGSEVLLPEHSTRKL